MNTVKSFFVIIALLFFISSCNSINPARKKNIPSVTPSLTITPSLKLAKKMDEAKGMPIGTTDKFSTDDPEAVAYLELKNLSGNHVIKWDWHKPNGDIYCSTGDHPISIGKEKYVEKTDIWHKISIKGDPAENDCGKWQVKVYFDGKLVEPVNNGIFWIEKTGILEEKKETERYQREPNALKGYVWTFEKPDKWDDKDTKLYISDFTEELLKKECFFILQRPDFEKLLTQKKYEKEIRRIEDIPTDDLKTLTKHGAISVISIEIQDDTRGEINITARLNAFNHAVLAQETVQISSVKSDEPEVRRQKMKELAENLCNSINKNYPLIKEKLYGKTIYERTEKKWLKRQGKVLTQKISISPLSLIR